MSKHALLAVAAMQQWLCFPFERKRGEGLQLFRVFQDNITSFPCRTFYSIL